ncbi:hypothetical protein FZW96_00600 [Bacillus sp. BGMRC 2118]|nr:hypothetical protein FZW96_00600 [Bacillus sp. BGMRC 2118]
MKSNTTFALFVSLFVLGGFPIIFLLISINSGDWNYFLYSLFPSFFAGLLGLIFSLQQMKKEMRKS